MSMTEQRSRTRKLASGVWTSFASRGIAALTPIFALPVSVSQLGLDGYGAWSAALAFAAFAAFADLGLGVGLMTRVASSLAVSDERHARAIISTGYALLGAVALSLVGLLWLSSLWVDWGVMVGASPGNTGAELIMLVTLSAFLANIPVSLVVRVQYAVGRMGVANVWQAIGSIATLVTVYVAAAVNLGDALFVAVATFAPVLMGLLNSIGFFGSSTGRPIRPDVRCFRVSLLAELFSLGSRFLLIMVLTSAALGTDAWIVAQTGSLEAATAFSVPARIFALLSVVVSILNVPLWPIAVEALKRGDVGWVEHAVRRMTVISVSVVTASAAIGVVAGPVAIDVWLGGAVAPSTFFLTGLGLWAIVQALVAPAFMVQNAAEVLQPQIVGYALLLVVIPVKWWVSSAAGFEWLPYVSVIGYSVFMIPASYVGYRRAIPVAASVE